MPRYHNINGENVQFSDAEETARDAEEKAAEDGKPARFFKALRQERNAKLAESDWMSFGDSPDMSDEWKAYRKKLRDLPSTLDNTTVLKTITWPTKPN